MSKNSHFNKKNILYTCLIILFFLILAVFSEIIYTTNNDPKFLRRVLLEKAVSKAKNDEAYWSLRYLFLSTSLRINNQSKKYPGVVNVNDFKSNKETLLKFDYDKTPYIDYLKSLDTDSVFNSSDVDFLRIYYDLTLIAYKNDYSNDILPLLKTAMYLEPQLSHVHIEIANYYLLTNQPENAKKQLEWCMTLPSPRYHCLLYSQNQEVLKETESVGFLKDGIDQQYR